MLCALRYLSNADLDRMLHGVWWPVGITTAQDRVALFPRNRGRTIGHTDWHDRIEMLAEVRQLEVSYDGSSPRILAVAGWRWPCCLDMMSAYASQGLEHAGEGVLEIRRHTTVDVLKL